MNPIFSRNFDPPITVVEQEDANMTLLSFGLAIRIDVDFECGSADHENSGVKWFSNRPLHLFAEIFDVDPVLDPILPFQLPLSS